MENNAQCYFLVISSSQRKMLIVLSQPPDTTIVSDYESGNTVSQRTRVKRVVLFRERIVPISA